MARSRPDRIGPYRIETELAVGESGPVYAARDAQGRRLAFKLHEGESGQRSLEAEVAMLGVRHPGLAACLDVNRCPGTGDPYTVTEYVEGVRLAPGAVGAHLRGPDLAASLLAAVAFVHEAGLLHRDLKADNVWLEAGTGVPVILDFGLCCPRDDAARRPLAGTPGSMAPELLKGRTASVQSDLWACGLLLAEALLARPLFSATEPADMATERLAYRGLGPQDRARLEDESLAAMISHLLDPDPEQRPPDGRAALAMLDGVGDGLLAELDRADLEGRLTAVLAEYDPRRAALLGAVGRGALWIDLFATPRASLAQAAEAVLGAALAVPRPSGRLKARLSAFDDRTTPVRALDLVGLVEALAEVGPLVVAAGVAGAADGEMRSERADVVTQLRMVRGVQVFDEPLPLPEEGQAVLTAWLGPQDVLGARLRDAPPQTRTELEGALHSLVRTGAVRAGPEGAVVRERDLPDSWPSSDEGEISGLLDGHDGELLGLLALSPWPLAAETCADILGRDVRGDLGLLQRAGLVRRERSHPADVYEPADGRLRRQLLGRVEVSAKARRALARALGGGGAAPDEDRAAAIADVLGTEDPPDHDDEALAELILSAAESLRRMGRLGLAVDLLRRGLAGASAASPHLRRLYLDLVDILIRGGGYDEALRVLGDAQMRLPADAGLAEREARIHVLRGRDAEAMVLLEGVDAGGLDEEDAVLVLRTRSDALKALGRLEEAGADLREALRRQGGEPHRVSMTLLGRAGLIEEKLGRSDEAVRLLESCIAMGRELGQDALVGPVMSNLGRILRVKGEKRRGLAIQEEAAQRMEAAGNVVGLAYACTGIGIAWLSLGRVDTARRYLARALSLAERLGDVSLQATLHDSLAQALASEGRHDEAARSFERGLELLEDRGDGRRLATLLIDRGRWCLRRGRLDEAGTDLVRARACMEGIESTALGLAADLLEAEACLARGEPAPAVERARRAEAQAEREGLAAERLTARNLCAQAGEDDLEDVEAETEERGPWLADLLFTRAVLRERGGRPEAADQDTTLALTLLGETPDGPVECRGLVSRIASDLDRLDVALAEGAPDFAAVGELLSRVSLDAERARVLVEVHALEPLRRDLDRLDGRFLHMQHEGEDVKGLSRLAERVRDLERLTEINKALNSERDTQKLLDLIVDSAVELTGAARGFLILFDGRAEEFRAARNIDESTIHNPEFQVSHSVAREVMRNKEPMLTANAIDDPRFARAASISELKLLSILCVPLVSRDRGLGAIYLDHPQVVGRFGEHHFETVTRLAGQAAIALENARLSEGLKDTNVELRESREEVARLNEALQSRLERREAELEEVKESLDASQRALGLRYDYSRIITRSARMHAVLDLMDRVIDTHFPVVITGESGTGKELIASAIHFNGPRKQENFVSLNCAAIPEPLIESELFGAVRGAFTGADRDRKGLFDQADRGTLFLDEIGDMSLDVQKRLLRVLQEGEFLPVGGREVRQVDVRILCATHRDLKAMVGDGQFREDLYYRLAVAQISLPPLRERSEDLGPLVQHFLEVHGGGARTLMPEALAILERQPWPGNVRELSNFVMNLLLFDKDGDQVSASLVRRVLGTAEPEGEPALPAAAEDGPLRARLEAFERLQVEGALAGSDGNKSEAARQLGVSVRTLYKMLSRLGLA